MIYLHSHIKCSEIMNMQIHEIMNMQKQIHVNLLNMYDNQIMNQYMEKRTEINMKIKLTPYTKVRLWTRNMNIKLLTSNENQTKFEKITDSINI